MRQNKTVTRYLALLLSLLMLLLNLASAWAEGNVGITTPTDISSEPIQDGQPAEVPEEVPPVIPSEIPETSENSIMDRIAACGHAYVTTAETTKVYSTAAMEEANLLYTITQTGAVLLAIEYDQQADLHPVRVWFLTDSG